MVGLNAAKPQPPVVFNPPPQVINPAPPVINPPLPDNNPLAKDNPVNPFGGKTYTYSQSTGQFKLDNQVLGVGYSGKGAAKNNAGMQGQRDGPVPLGEYIITGKQKDARLGGLDAVGLLPKAGGNFFNRFPVEPFAIIFETNPPGNPPSGAIIVLPRNAWDQITTEHNTRVQVVP
jgi:hypothetical protein